jgi:dihydrofolate reductase
MNLDAAELTGRTQYYTAATLDGFIADANHSLEWLFQFGESVTDDFPAFITAIGAAAMGSATYEWLLRHLQNPTTDHPQPWPYAHPVWVFTTRALPGVEGADIRFVRGDVAPVHQEMIEAAAGKNVWIVGGGDLAGQFHDRGLLDEIIVTVAAVTLGAGKPLLPRTIIAPPLRLISAERVGVSFAQLRYYVQRSGQADCD